MTQVCYGNITITDTTDIGRIYTVYAKSANNTTVPSTAKENWSENVSTAPGSGNYIWQRTVVEKSGTSEKTFSDPVCLTGEEGTDGKGISSIVIKYGTSADWDTQPANWYDNIPEYSSATPNYWTQTTINYTTGNPTIKTTQDKALTQAVYDAAIANSVAQHANEDAQGAMSQAAAAIQRVQAKYGTSATEAATVAKVANCDGFQLFNGAEVFIKFTYKNNIANPTLNVNSTGAKSIRDSDGNALDSKFYWKDGSLVHFVYDGSYWRILDIVTTEKYNNLVSDINGISQTVGTKANQTDLTNLTTRVSTNETNISQTATSITSLVSNQDTYTAPDGTTKTNTIKSAIKQNADNISLRVEKNGVIAAINASTESSGGSAVKISADKVNIEGAAIFTSGRLSTTNLENTIDGRIPEIPDDVSDLTDTTGKIPTKVSDLSDSSSYAKTTDIPNVSGFATKADAVYRTQRIYRRYESAQSNLSGPTTWVTASTNIYNNWTTKIPPLTSGNTIYAYLYTCVQKQTITQYNGGTGTTCTCTPVLLDDTTTVINGGSIIAGSVTANEITGSTLSAIYANMGTITAGEITKGYNSINFNNDPATLEFKNGSTWATATQGIKYDGTTGLAIKGNVITTSGEIGGWTIGPSSISSSNTSSIKSIVAGTRTASSTGDGVYIASNGVLNVGKQSGNYLTFDGENLDLKTDWLRFDDNIDSIIIGKDNESHISIDYHSFTMQDSEDEFFRVEDKRNSQGIATIADTSPVIEKYNSWQSSSQYKTIVTDCYPEEINSVIIQNAGDLTQTTDVTEDDNVYTQNATYLDNLRFDRSNLPYTKNIIKIEYTTTEKAISFTFGSRNSSKNVGKISFASGSEVIASGSFSHVEGGLSEASGSYSHAEGTLTIASGQSSHAEGDHTKASGTYSHAEGSETEAMGLASHAKGYKTIAYGDYSHAEGNLSQSFGEASHVQGNSCWTYGDASFATGIQSDAEGEASNALGEGAYARKKAQTVIGTWCNEDISTTTTHPSNNTDYGAYAFIIGNGQSYWSPHSNALTVDWKGVTSYYRDVTNTSLQIPINGSSTISSVTYATGSGGKITEISFTKKGNLAMIRFQVTSTSTISSGSNILTAQLVSKYHPAQYTTGVGYYGGHAIVGRINTSGQLIIRNASSSGVTLASSNGGVEVAFTYILKNYFA